jgi:hypothetical protein
MLLYISEEYGYRHWLAELTAEEYEELLARWSTMRGLNCLVPVFLIVPQAKEFDGTFVPCGALKCHLHECDDSYLEGSDYKIPNDLDGFWMSGIHYSTDRIRELFKATRKK